MFKVTETDFVSMKDIFYGWRWTDRSRVVIPSHDLERIRPLSIEKANQAWHYAKAFQGAQYWKRFREVDTYEVDGRGSAAVEDACRDWLNSRLTSGTDTIIVSWTERQAVRTDVATFQGYWATFCFPVEDIVIWPHHENWVLLFDYKQRFYFAEERLAN